MIKTLRESQEELSELVEAASRGEDVLITVEGKVKARLTKAEDEPSEMDKKAWLEEIDARLREQDTGRKPSITTEEILDEIRADRL